jgi:hypothetical protein
LVKIKEGLGVPNKNALYNKIKKTTHPKRKESGRAFYNHTMKTQNETNEKNGLKSLAMAMFQKEDNDLSKLKEVVKTAQDLINETEAEPFTIEERTDLNIKKVVGK